METKEAPPEKIEIPQSFSIWQFVRIIHQTQSSTIFLAMNTKTNQLDACKLFARSAINGPGFLQMVEEEIRLAETIKGEGIANIKKVLYLPDYIIMVMEYYPCGNLYDFIVRGGSISEPCALNMLYKIAKALSILHHKKVAHRDIKLENIVFSSDYTPHIIDFGLATQYLYTKNDMHTTVCGTFEYIPPEVLERKEYDPRKADIWSLGICFYIMLLGRYPWSQIDNIHILFDQIKNKTIDLNCLPDVSRGLLTKMLQKDPTKRCTIDEVLKEIEMSRRPERPAYIKSLIIKPPVRTPAFDKLFAKSSRQITRRVNSY